jgi:predicted ester cyclase
MKASYLLLLLAVCFISACRQKETQADKNRQAALASVHAFEKADLAAMKRFCGPGFMDYGNGESKPIGNLDSMKVSMDVFYAAFPDQKVTNLRAYSSGDTVVVTNIRTGTFTRPLMGIKPTGKHYNYADAEILVFNKDGMIISHRAIQSDRTIFGQVGIALPANE